MKREPSSISKIVLTIVIPTSERRRKSAWISLLNATVTMMDHGVVLLVMCEKTGFCHIMNNGGVKLLEKKKSKPERSRIKAMVLTKHVIVTTPVIILDGGKRKGFNLKVITREKRAQVVLLDSCATSTLFPVGNGSNDTTQTL
mmetsp:Transcript_8240/g.10142  ORF Transcript_8240/g.10142 Transcript_8240/m.10142 type:complete len:143 (+) Transcript_8240:2628-3056(+)